MSILNNLKDFFIPTEVDDDTETGYKNENNESENESTSSSYTSAYGTGSSTSTSSRRESNYTSSRTESRGSSSYASSGVSSAPASSARTAFSGGTPTLQVILVKPTEYTDAKKIADHLMNGRTVVLVLEDATETTRRRIIDFLIGVAYAMNGNLKPIANQTYIVTPHDVGLVDQLMTALGKDYSTATSNSNADTSSLM